MKQRQPQWVQVGWGGKKERTRGPGNNISQEEREDSLSRARPKFRKKKKKE